jgi:hypothetical protein
MIEKADFGMIGSWTESDVITGTDVVWPDEAERDRRRLTALKATYVVRQSQRRITVNSVTLLMCVERRAREIGACCAGSKHAGSEMACA